MLFVEWMEVHVVDGWLISRRLISLGVLLLWTIAWTGCFAQGQQDADSLKAKRLTNVGGYPRDHLAGSMALHAISSALGSQNNPRLYLNLVAESGAVFKFVYDSTEAYEPLRDASPVDLLHNAAVMNGFPDARWETGLTLDQARRLIKHEIDAGRPLVSPFLKTDEYHGFNIITGYDYERDMLLVQGAFNRRRSFEIPIADGWDGPTMSPMGWATNPLFVLGGMAANLPAPAEFYAGLLKDGVRLLEGGRLEYGRHEGERPYMSSPGPHMAWYGLPAYDVLVADVGDRGLTVVRGGRQELNFGLIWRIDAMVGLLEHDRMAGSELVLILRDLLSEEQTPFLLELSGNYEQTAADAAELHDIFWHAIPDSVMDPGDVVEYVRTSRAMVFGLPGRAGLADSLRARGLTVYETPWGDALVEGSPERRLGAKIKAISLKGRESRSLSLLKEIVDHYEVKAETEPPPGDLRSPAEQETIQQGD
jgi:hypothetical protein